MSQNNESIRAQIVVGILMLIIGLLAGFGTSQMTVAKEVTDKLMTVQNGWTLQFSDLKSVVTRDSVQISDLKEADLRQVNAINGLHPIIEAAVQQNSLLLAWLRSNPALPIKDRGP